MEVTPVKPGALKEGDRVVVSGVEETVPPSGETHPHGTPGTISGYER
ncbi:hypothetical protein ACFQX6_49835 [Streptosporangium lutulentum]